MLITQHIQSYCLGNAFKSILTWVMIITTMAILKENLYVLQGEALF